jgi:hypothetical protein
MLLNTAWYVGIVCALYWLYSAHNHHPNNKPGSSSQFVYQQF